MDKMETLLSVGIDIGTTTTQLVFTRLTMEISGGYGCVPTAEITEKKILYYSPIHFTPLDGDRIDGAKVAELVRAEYTRAGFSPADIDTGALIVTGETARRRNASAVISEVSKLCGNFVAAAAGPDLESRLSGKGSGCCALSEKFAYTGKNLCNLDIGGGTSNLSVFCGGKSVATACLDIGGRLIRVDANNIVTYIAPKLITLLQRHGIFLSIGDALSPAVATQICTVVTKVLETACGLWDGDTRSTEDAVDAEADLSLLLCTAPLGVKPDYFTFSGGVADCISEGSSDFRYGDIGVYLGRSLRQSRFFKEGCVIPATETVRATVIGAGSYSLSLSGSTVFYQNIDFPMKSVPVACIQLESGNDIENLGVRAHMALEETRRMYGSSGALVLKGIHRPSFIQIEQIASELAQKVYSPDEPFVILTHEDCAKALGQALLRRLGHGARILCADGLTIWEENFIDIGTPVSGGLTIPVVIKTLIFQ